MKNDSGCRVPVVVALQLAVSFKIKSEISLGLEHLPEEFDCAVFKVDHEVSDDAKHNALGNEVRDLSHSLGDDVWQ